MDKNITKSFEKIYYDKIAPNPDADELRKIKRIRESRGKQKKKDLSYVS